MAHVVRQVLERISSILMRRLDSAGAEDLIKNDNIMARTSSALKARMRLDEEIPEPNFCNTTINHSAGIAVGRAVGLGLRGRIEASVVTFAADNYGNLREPLLCGDCRVSLLAGVANQWKL